MSQARRRGSFEERKLKAMMRGLPEYLTCNNCEAKVYELTPLDTKGLTGLDAACFGACGSCQQITYGVSGDPLVCQEFLAAMTMQAGEESSLKAAIETMPLRE